MKRMLKDLFSNSTLNGVIHKLWKSKTTLSHSIGIWCFYKNKSTAIHKGWDSKDDLKLWKIFVKFLDSLIFKVPQRLGLWFYLINSCCSLVVVNINIFVVLVRDFKIETRLFLKFKRSSGKILPDFWFAVTEQLHFISHMLIRLFKIMSLRKKVKVNCSLYWLCGPL